MHALQPERESPPTSAGALTSPARQHSRALLPHEGGLDAQLAALRPRADGGPGAAAHAPEELALPAAATFQARPGLAPAAPSASAGAAYDFAPREVALSASLAAPSARATAASDFLTDATPTAAPDPELAIGGGPRAFRGALPAKESLGDKGGFEGFLATSRGALDEARAANLGLVTEGDAGIVNARASAKDQAKKQALTAFAAQAAQQRSALLGYGSALTLPQTKAIGDVRARYDGARSKVRATVAQTRDGIGQGAAAARLRITESRTNAEGEVQANGAHARQELADMYAQSASVPAAIGVQVRAQRAAAAITEAAEREATNARAYAEKAALSYEIGGLTPIALAGDDTHSYASEHVDEKMGHEGRLDHRAGLMEHLGRVGGDGAPSTRGWMAATDREERVELRRDYRDFRRDERHDRAAARQLPWEAPERIARADQLNTRLEEDRHLDPMQRGLGHLMQPFMSNSYPKQASRVAGTAARYVGQHYAEQIASESREASNAVLAEGQRIAQEVVAAELEAQARFARAFDAQVAELDKADAGALQAIADVSATELAVVEDREAGASAAVESEGEAVCARLDDAEGLEIDGVEQSAEALERAWRDEVDWAADELDRVVATAREDVETSGRVDGDAVSEYLEAALAYVTGLRDNAEDGLAKVTAGAEANLAGRDEQSAANLDDFVGRVGDAMAEALEAVLDVFDGVTGLGLVEQISDNHGAVLAAMMNQARVALEATAAKRRGAYDEVASEFGGQADAFAIEVASALAAAVAAMPRELEAATIQAVYDTIGTRGEYSAKVVVIATLAIAVGVIAAVLAAPLGLAVIPVMAAIGAAVGVLGRVIVEAIDGTLTTPDPEKWKGFVIDMLVGAVSGAIAGAVAFAGAALSATLEKAVEAGRMLSGTATLVEIGVGAGVDLVADFFGNTMGFFISRGIEGLEIDAESYREAMFNAVQLTAWLGAPVVGALVGGMLSEAVDGNSVKKGLADAADGDVAAEGLGSVKKRFAEVLLEEQNDLARFDQIVTNNPLYEPKSMFAGVNPLYEGPSGVATELLSDSLRGADGVAAVVPRGGSYTVAQFVADLVESSATTAFSMSLFSAALMTTMFTRGAAIIGYQPTKEDVDALLAALDDRALDSAFRGWIDAQEDDLVAAVLAAAGLR